MMKKRVVLAVVLAAFFMQSLTYGNSVISLKGNEISPPVSKGGPWNGILKPTEVAPDQYNAAQAAAGVLPVPYPDPKKGMDMEISAEPTFPRVVSNEEILSYFQNAVIVGDSVAYGFQLHAKRHAEDPLFSSLFFLTAGSYSVHNAFWPVSAESVHPMYKGVQHPIWETVPMTGRKHVFTFFGLNDLNIGRDTPEKYVELLRRIKEQDPEVDFTILSCTYTLADKGSGHLNNTEIRDFNATMQKLAKQNGWGYIDLATPLSDGNGNLAPEYCSDAFVHQTPEAYAIWRDQLVQYAYHKLSLRKQSDKQ